jgi:3-dehydroquinate synthetase
LGGKTGINFENRKNMIGAFHFPSKVWIDPEITASLPDGVFAQGIAELIKTGFISSPLVVEKLENTGGLKQLRRDDDLIAELVTCAVNVKVGILNIDTFEDDRRMALNLGHTTAHALERALPDRISHGDAVSIGLLAAGMISERMGIAEEPVTDLLRGLLAKYGLPLVYEGPAGDDLYDLCLSDKKFSYGETVWVLPERVGKVRLVRNVPERIVKEVFDLLRK